MFHQQKYSLNFDEIHTVFLHRNLTSTLLIHFSLMWSLREARVPFQNWLDVQESWFVRRNILYIKIYGLYLKRLPKYNAGILCEYRMFNFIFFAAFCLSVCISWFIFVVNTRSIIQRISPCPRLLVNFRNMIIFYSEELLAPRPTPKLEDHPLSAVRDCLFNIFAATLHIWRPFPPSATRGRAMPWILER
jgi:hypothetical protein